MNKTKYMQTDSRWSGLGYPSKPCTIGNSGCGEVAVCNSIIEMSAYKGYTPKTIQPYCKKYAARDCDGTYHYGIPKMLEHYDLTDVKEHATMQKLWKELEKGNRIAILLMGSKRAGSKKVHWTSSGHFVCAVAYKYKDGKHYLYVKDSYSNSSKRNGWITYEGNLKGAVYKVWSGKLKAEPKQTEVKDGKIKVDGKGGHQTVKAMQKFFGTTVDGTISGQQKKQKQYYPSLTAVEYGKGGSECIKKLQKWVGVKEDGILGKGTVAAWQKKLKDAKYYTHRIDGNFGVQSMKAWQKYLNEHDKPTYPTPTPTNTESKPTTTKPTASKPKPTKAKKGAEKIVAKVKKYAWKYGTKHSKYKYNKVKSKSGKPKSAYKKALKKYCHKKARISQTDCGYFVNTCVRATGLSKSFDALPDKSSKAYPKVPSGFKIVHKGKKIPKGFLQAGDIIRYKKKSGQHTMIYMGGGKIAEGQRGHNFPAIKKDTKKYNASNVKHNTIQVIRAVK